MINHDKSQLPDDDQCCFFSQSKGPLGPAIKKKNMHVQKKSRQLDVVQDSVVDSASGDVRLSRAERFRLEYLKDDERLGPAAMVTLFFCGTISMSQPWNKDGNDGHKCHW